MCHHIFMIKMSTGRYTSLQSLAEVSQRLSMDFCGKADQIRYRPSFNSGIVLALAAAYARLQHCPKRDVGWIEIG